MNRTITLPAPAKLNLFLHITGKREDGYHNLQTLFTFIDKCDELTFTLTGSDNIEIVPEIPGVALEDNLIFKAASCLLADRKIQTGVRIELKKVLPMGGGIGGGSSDAATTLVAMNYLWNCGLSEDELARRGRILGADVPVFVRGKTAFAEGVGEILTPVDLPEKWYLVVVPHVHVSTKEIFTHPDLPRNTKVQSWSDLSKGKWHNDCEILVKKLYPLVANALDWLVKYAPSRMTGSGACVFGEFPDEHSANLVLKELPANWTAFVAKGCCQSPLIEKLDNYLQIK